MLNGSLDENLAQRWAWDVDCKPEERLAANPTYQIEADLADLRGKGRKPEGSEYER
jgi:hypothetical protein